MRSSQRSHATPLPLAELTGRLRQRSLRITGPRQAILDALRHQERPATMREILRTLGTQRCDLATIYRSMHLLEVSGLVRRVQFEDRTARFELRREGPEDHHHHLICERCARVVEVTECFAPDLEARIARESGYTQLSHRLQFYGVCPQCQSSASVHPSMSKAGEPGSPESEVRTCSTTQNEMDKAARVRVP